MSEIVDRQTEIPNSLFYVVSTDTYMSGWGEAAGKTNMLIFPCETYLDAETVKDNCEARDDQKDVEIVAEKPDVSDKNILYCLYDPETCSRWYEEGGFDDSSN